QRSRACCVNGARMRQLTAVVVLLGLGCSSSRGAEQPTAQGDAPSITCYAGVVTRVQPDATQVGVEHALVRRTVDRKRSVIVEEVVVTDRSPAVESVVTMFVQGNQVRMTESHKMFEGEGELQGEPWKWTRWHTVSTLADGAKVESEDELVDGKLKAHKKY